nr:hypothetical protein [Chroococcidiopsis sp. CCALA 051]
MWVLRGNPYKFGREEILNTLEMMQSPTFEFENRSAVYQALQRAKQGRANFSNYLIIGAIAIHADCQETVSFDRKLEGERGFRCLTQD